FIVSIDEKTGNNVLTPFFNKRRSLVFFETEDPNHFWVECDGRGKALVPGYPEGYCENHYIHSFELENGRIKRNREFMNPMQKLRALGIAVPQIKRDGIPT
ncbi:PhzA/PhzB family protein, partial [Pseudomonas aeruginosa]|uniref:PhzA/PhzB family protein n=1 Tax=Pseudomonas aeruginosa TaxID=287 RepID=UPI003982C8B5